MLEVFFYSVHTDVLQYISTTGGTLMANDFYTLVLDLLTPTLTIAYMSLYICMHAVCCHRFFKIIFTFLCLLPGFEDIRKEKSTASKPVTYDFKRINDYLPWRRAASPEKGHFFYAIT